MGLDRALVIERPGSARKHHSRPPSKVTAEEAGAFVENGASRAPAGSRRFAGASDEILHELLAGPLAARGADPGRDRFDSTRALLKFSLPLRAIRN